MLLLCVKCLLLKERIKRRKSLFEKSLERALFISKEPETNISDIRIFGVNKKQETYFQKSIRLKKRKMSTRLFEKQYNRLLANENVRNAYPSMTL